ncbi:hypothetical protein [Nocardioides terrisoli]|uniref:hypothetical protein n=1 Tax=Nocardioides terrisoli TaxID=3388267 RepID=UPI00287BBC2C|nr:hypothetical protein [Nocardioides marmorisolisilvae]
MTADSNTPLSRPRGPRWALLALLVTLALTVATFAPGAGAAPAQPSPSRPATSRIQYTSKTVLVPKKTARQQLKSVSKDGATYTFKKRTGALRKLKPGRVMLLPHLAVRDVTKVKRHHGRLVVRTRPAAITDLVKSGSISLSSPIDFKKGFVIGRSAVPPEARERAGSVASKLGMVPLSTPGGVKVSGSVEGYDFEATFTQEKSAVAVSITVSRKTPVKLDVTLTGTLDNLRTAGNVSVSKGRLTRARMLANHLRGSFKLEYAAQPISSFGLGQAGGIRVELPAEIVVPFFVGPVPFFLGVRVAIFVGAGFSSFDQKLSGQWSMTYDGEGGITASSSGATSPAGVLDGLGKIILNAINAVKTGPITFVFGAQMPQLQLGLGVKGFNVAGNVTLIGNTEIATYGSGCDTRKMEVLGTAGANASFFGLSADFGTATLFDKTVRAAYPAGCGTAP